METWQRYCRYLPLSFKDVDKTLHIKGQMIFVQEWNQILFLACPMMNDLNNLIWCGLFINELSMHDYSRDIMLATTQEHIELRMSLSAAEAKARALNDQLNRLDEVQQRTDELLYQMIPKSVASKLRHAQTVASKHVFNQCNQDRFLTLSGLRCKKICVH